MSEAPPATPASAPPAPDSIAARLAKARVWTLLGFLVLVGAALAGAVQLRVDPTPQRIFETHDEEFVFLRRAHEVFGRDDDVILFHVRVPSGVFSPEGVALLRRLHAELAGIESLVGVDDLTTAWASAPGRAPAPLLRSGADLEEARELALASPLLAGRLVSRDATAALVLTRVGPERERYDDLVEPVDACLALAARVERPSGASVGVTGIPVARVLIARRLLSDQLTFFPVCALAFLVILWLLFRDLRAVVLPLAAVGLALILTAGVLGWTGEPIDIINNVLPVLIFVIGVSDAIHLLIRYRHELDTGRPQWEALTITIRHLLVACLITSVTTAVGFGSLGLASIEILKRFGLYAAVGVMLAYLVVIVFVPLVLSYLAPHLPPAGRAADRRMSELSLRLGRWVHAHRKRVLLGFAVVLALALVFAQRVQEENNLYEAFHEDDPLIQANEALERDFAGIFPVTVFVEWEEGRGILDPAALSFLAELQEAVEEQHFPALSVLDLLAELTQARTGERRLPQTRPEAVQTMTALQLGLNQQGRGELLRRLIRPEQRALRITARAADAGAQVLQARFRAIEAWIAANATRAQDLGLEARLTGDGPVASRGVNQLIGDLFSSLLLALAIILPIMCLLLRSVRAGLVSMIPNATPLLLTLGMMGLVGMDLRVTSVIVFTVSLGLAVDDTIHFMVRFREEWRLGAKDADPELVYQLALERTFAGTGGAIVTTTVLLSLGFGALLFSRFPITRTFGFLMEVTVIGALVADLLLLPACLALFKPFRRDRIAAPSELAQPAGEAP